ncbi:hypothetical protein HYN56_16845 [Flavobacterium crocinum]|uniref:DUF2938 domain-containing protein n=2 Tax=Flavobacterium crocinum TaxID=2183896 RepID=A0A2S1YNZ9_9FLAO|nr:hypothetical protein HYN56_16845 [Flavobacterium crocinum]
MTWFSYAMSKKFRELYKEPVLLAYAIDKMKIKIAEKTAKTSGWISHYAIGFLFVLGYHFLWLDYPELVSPARVLLLGAASGIIGILSWMFIFEMTHYNPQINFKGYYIQLFFAHMIFAITARVLYSITLTLSILIKSYVTL